MLLGLADNECIELPSKTFFFFSINYIRRLEILPNYTQPSWHPEKLLSGGVLHAEGTSGPYFL